jgi:hypothetical protein
MDALVRKVSGLPAEPEKKARWQLKLPSLKRRDAEVTARPQILAGAER